MVLGHWLMVAITPDGHITNALAVVPALQPLTWLLQVMPLFFLVGGFSNRASLTAARRRGDADATWLRGRLTRCADIRATCQKRRRTGRT